MLIVAILEFLSEVPENRSANLMKWPAWLMALGLTALPMIAESAEGFVDHRAQMMLPFIGVVFFSILYGLHFLASRYKILTHPIVIGAGVLLVLLTAIGAERGIRENLVGIRVAQMEFIRTEALAQDLAEMDKIVVVLPGEQVCLSEPCNPFMGFEPHSEAHLSIRNGYDYALFSLGIEPGTKQFAVVAPGEDDQIPGAVIIDWTKYIQIRKLSD